MKVAFLMGNRLNAWHTRMYEPLLRMGVAVKAFTYRPLRYTLTEVHLPHEIIPTRAETRGWGKRVRESLLRHLTGKPINEDPFDLPERLKGFDLIHSWELFSVDTEAALEARARWKIPVLVTVWDNIPHHYEEDSRLRQRKQRARNEADGFLVYTNLSREMLIEEGVEARRIHRVPPAIDLEVFYPAEDPPDSPVLLGVGRMVPEKGFEDLIEAAALLKKESATRSLRLHLLGSGPHEKALDQLAEERGLTECYHRTDSLPYTSLPDFLREGTVLGLGSRETPDWAEQFGMILLESMACGVPVVGARSGAIPEIVDDAGWLYPPGNVDELIKGLRELFGNPGFWMDCRKRGLERCRERFSANENAKRIFQLYESLQG